MSSKFNKLFISEYNIFQETDSLIEYGEISFHNDHGVTWLWSQQKHMGVSVSFKHNSSFTWEYHTFMCFVPDAAI